VHDDDNDADNNCGDAEDEASPHQPSVRFGRPKNATEKTISDKNFIGWGLLFAL
jgi:hypothetical protein